LKQVLLYLPVIHAGYEGFFERHADADEILLLGDGFRAVFPQLAKEIRALEPRQAARYLSLTVRRPHLRVIEPPDLPEAITGDTLVMPDEDIMRSLASVHGLERGRVLVFDNTFLRWDRHWSKVSRPASFDGRVSFGELPREMLALADRLSSRSSDWWRQVGAVAAREREVLAYAWNRHHPTEYSPYIDGDPRNVFRRGLRADLSTAIHAEAAVVAQSARDGIPLKGADLYTTTFPCPACARLIAETGFRRCFFAGPYSVLSGDNVLHAAGIELIWVDAAGPPDGDF
jgi:dCMP deaminase